MDFFNDNGFTESEQQEFNNPPVGQASQQQQQQQHQPQQSQQPQQQQQQPYQNYQKPAYQQNNSGGGNSNWKGNQGGGNSNWKGNQGGQGGKPDWRAEQDKIKPPYLPVAIFMAADIPSEMKDLLMKTADKLVSMGLTVRYNADESYTYEKMNVLSRTNVEAYTPFKDFKDLKTGVPLVTGFCWSNPTTKKIAETATPGWEKVPNFVRNSIERNVRILFGTRNSSPVKYLITWSADGVNKASLTTREGTGYTKAMIDLADRYYYPIINIASDEGKRLLSQLFLEGNYQNEQR